MKRLWVRFKHNWFLKVISLFFAVIIWSMVLSGTDPARTRKVEDVPIRRNNTQTLTDKGLIVRSMSQSTAEMRVSVQLSQLQMLDKSHINAFIELADIEDVGEYEMDVRCQMQNGMSGTVVTVQPPKVTVVVDYIERQTIPIEYEYTGTLAEGLYLDENTFTGQTNLAISGPRADVQSVFRAVCRISLDGVTAEQGLNGSYRLVLLNEEGGEMDNSLFDMASSVTVRADVLHTKTVPIANDIGACVKDMNRLEDGYEIAGVTFNPSQVQIAGEQTVMDATDKLLVVPISVRGATESIMDTAVLDIPDGIRVLTDGNIEITIHIQPIPQSTADGEPQQ